MKIKPALSKKLYDAICRFCKDSEISPYRFGGTIGISNNYIYKLRKGSNGEFHDRTIRKIFSVLGAESLKDAIAYSAQQKIVKEPGMSCADKYALLPEEDQIKVTALTNLLYDKKLLREQIARRMEMIFKD